MKYILVTLSLVLFSCQSPTIKDSSAENQNRPQRSIASESCRLFSYQCLEAVHSELNSRRIYATDVTLVSSPNTCVTEDIKLIIVRYDTGSVVMTENIPVRSHNGECITVK